MRRPDAVERAADGVPVDVALVCEPHYCAVDEGTADLSGAAVVAAVVVVAFVWDSVATWWHRGRRDV